MTMTSTSMTKTRFAMSLPTKIAHRAPGYSNRDSSAPPSNSNWYDRLKASTPAKRIANHIAPAAADRNASVSGPRANPNKSRTNTPMKATAFSPAFVRRSVVRSFQTIALMRRHSSWYIRLKSVW